MSDQKQPFHVIGGTTHASEAELLRLRKEVEARNRQEIAIAELGQAALTGVDPSILLGQACALVEMTLGVDHCRALEITAAGRIEVRAAIGSNPTFAYCRNDDEENEAVAMYITLAGTPVTFDNLEQETRFKSSHLRDYHGVRSGAGVIIPTASGAFGVLLAYSTTQRTFEEYEIGFLKSTANLLGEALERAYSEEALHRSESRMQQLIASTLDAVVTVDRRGVVIQWNPQAEAIFGLKARDVIGNPLRQTFPTLQDIIAGAYPTRRLETTVRRSNGEDLEVEVLIDPVGTGEEESVTAFVRDISERKRAQADLEQREQRFRALVEKSWSGVALLDIELAFTYVGSSTLRLLGYTDEDVIGSSFLALIHPRDREEIRDGFKTLVATPGGDVQTELRFQHKSGTWVWLEVFAQNLLHDSSVGSIVVNYRDITQRKATEKQLEYQAYYDALTGLPNRLLFRDRVVNAIAQARRHRSGMAVLYLDLDHFKLVNDGLGHSIGDGLLSEVAARLQSSIRASDTVSRLGGDEFTILLNDTSSSEAVFGVARKILQSVARRFRVESHELFITASIGISIFPTDGEDVETLLKCADSAMYRAKELGRNQAQLFTPSMNERYVRRLALEQSLHHAVDRNELEVYYQPIYERSRKRIVAVEALVRWNHPTRGILEPAEFIQLGEETGLIVPIGHWVIGTACRQLREWHDAGLTTLRLAVNISAPQLHHPHFVDFVIETLTSNRLDPALLDLEITESVALHNVEQTIQILNDIKQHGVKIAIDDFGAGQSSLIYVKRFPIDSIKIDKSLIRDVSGDDTATAIVSYIINLAHTLKLEVVAEGVETEEQYAFLRLTGCDRVQGYLFGRPGPAGSLFT
jgi:diguanylate cyclase (GGDEF)-like protein/PAS domain S-box-containing protein